MDLRTTSRPGIAWPFVYVDRVVVIGTFRRTGVIPGDGVFERSGPGSR
jgi:hypothetical protein